MKSSMHIAAATAALLVLASNAALSADQERDVIIPAEAIQLSPALGPGLPPGVQSAAVFGDPGQPGVYVLRNTFPPNVTLNPHTHGQKWRIYTIMTGEVRFGFGTKVDPAKSMLLRPGSVVATFEKPHYFVTGPSGATLNVVADGPFITNFLAQ
jgi:hypothetical protein